METPTLTLEKQELSPEELLQSSHAELAELWALREMYVAQVAENRTDGMRYVMSEVTRERAMFEEYCQEQQISAAQAADIMTRLDYNHLHNNVVETSVDGLDDTQNPQNLIPAIDMRISEVVASMIESHQQMAAVRRENGGVAYSVQRDMSERDGFVMECEVVGIDRKHAVRMFGAISLGLC